MCKKYSTTKAKIDRDKLDEECELVPPNPSNDFEMEEALKESI